MTIIRTVQEGCSSTELKAIQERNVPKWCLGQSSNSRLNLALSEAVLCERKIVLGQLLG